MQEDSPFKPGDVVELLSGGPSMTITRCIKGSLNSPDEWTCDVVYMDAAGAVRREKNIEALFLRTPVEGLNLNGWIGDSNVSSGS